MLQHISEPIAELLGQRPKSVDTERIEQAIRNDGGVTFMAETMEEVLDDLKRTRRECEALRAEVERLRELVTDARDAMALMIGTDVRVPWQMVADEDVDSWIERIQQIKGGGE